MNIFLYIQFTYTIMIYLFITVHCESINVSSLKIGALMLTVPQIIVKMLSARGTSVAGITDPRILNVLIL